MTDLHPVIAKVTERITERSAATRLKYLDLIERGRDAGTNRAQLSCGNLAHGFAASGEDKAVIRTGRAMNIGIITAYNDMLSAHQPYGRYPEQIKIAAREIGATAQVAGGVPAMCDGVTQGQAGMDLSLFSRDTIALSTAVSLSHAMFEGNLMLGICDKIVPGLLIGALRFGHLPTILIPAGPMPSGLANKEKVRIRQLYAEGKVGREELLESESASYHGAGTCTFYGTANSNQMMMEVMGLHMPGAAFVNPGTKLRSELTRAATHRIADIGWDGNDYRPLGHCIDEKAIVNAIIGLMATGGSTNHAIHLPAIARAAGIHIDWTDFAELSDVVPLLARVYPNGSGDVNHFHAAGGMAVIIRELLDAGLLHRDIMTVARQDLTDYGKEPVLQVSAVDKERWTIEAPAAIFHDQDDVLRAFKAGELERDVVVVVRFQGPRANGMPELHKLTPALGVLQDRGFKVALLTDGRMSGASGKVPAAIHLSPEALGGGPIGKLRDGDLVRVCAESGQVEALVDAATWDARDIPAAPPPPYDTGRELFALFRHNSDLAEQGASPILAAMDAELAI
jgi:phosphogluconate dehydratase